MELIEKQGYKQTEVGLIPEDWKVKALGDVGDVQMCRRIFSYQTSKKGDVPFYKIGTFGKEPDAYIDWDLYQEFRKKFSFPKKGYLLISASGTIGRTVEYLGEDAYYQDSNIIWIDNDEKLISNKYLNYTLKVIKYNTEGSTIKRLYNSIIKSSKFVIPPTLIEQKAIATALSDVDALIASLEQTITKKKAIKQGAMQQLLTPPHKGGKRLPGFSGEWVEQKLGDVGDCIRGVTYRGDSDLYPFDNIDSIRLLRSNNVFDKNIVIKNLQYVKKEKVNSHQIMKSKDILICMANGSKALVGKAGQFKEANMQYTFGAFMGILRPNLDVCDGDFIFNMFSTYLFRCHLDIQLSGSSINNLNPSDIENFKFHSPSNPEQKAIAQILSDMDIEIAQLESKKAKYQAINQGIMQELLAGKTRLV